MSGRCWTDADRELAAKTLADYDRAAQVPLERYSLYAAKAEALLDVLAAAGWHPPLRHGDPHMLAAVYGLRIGAVLADLDRLIGLHTDHCDREPCPARVTLTRIRATLTGEEPT